MASNLCASFYSGLFNPRLACGTAVKSVCISISVCVCVTLGIIGILSDCFELLAGGRSRCKGLRLTKLPCIWEARSDQPGVPAFENLSAAKAVYFVVSFSKELLQRR